MIQKTIYFLSYVAGMGFVVMALLQGGVYQSNGCNNLATNGIVYAMIAIVFAIISHTEAIILHRKEDIIKQPPCTGLKP